MLKLNINKHPHIVKPGEQAKPASYTVDFEKEDGTVIYGFSAASAEHAKQTLGTILFALKATEKKFTTMEDHIDIVQGAIVQLKLLGE